MTPDQLAAIKAEADGDCSNCFELVAEVRRLRGLVQLGGVCGHCCLHCAFCQGSYRLNENREEVVMHAPDCAAFTPEGEVK